MGFLQQPFAIITFSFQLSALLISLLREIEGHESGIVFRPSNFDIDPCAKPFLQSRNNIVISNDHSIVYSGNYTIAIRINAINLIGKPSFNIFHVVIIDANCGCFGESGNKYLLAAIADVLPDATIIGTKGTGSKSAVRASLNVSHICPLVIYDSMSATIYMRIVPSYSK